MGVSRTSFSKRKFNRNSGISDGNDKSRDMDTLRKWIGGVAENLKKNMEEIKGQVGMAEFDGCLAFQFYCDIDIRDFTARDLDCLQPVLGELHQVCMQKNVAINIGGFDLLPWNDVMSSFNGISGKTGKGSFVIHIDASQGYNFDRNPFVADTETEMILAI